MHRILPTLLLLVAFSPAHAALGPDPEHDWSSAETRHFRINYATEQRAQAERIADIAERVYARLTRELHWEPDGKIEIVVIDEFDIANGYSTPLPFNKTALFLAPPNDGELLDNSTWLELLITHELTHTIHLDKVRGIPGVLRDIFGRNPLLFPNLWQPGWAIEGIATYNESTPDIGQGRLKGPMFEAWMRIEREQGFKTLAEINADGRALPVSKQYLYGAYFYEFLARKYGAASIYRYIGKFSGNIVPRVHTNPLLATGKNMDELWEEFTADLTQQITQRKALLEATPRADGDVILPARFRIDSLAPVPDGALAVVDDGLLRTRLVHIDAQGKLRHLANMKPGARLDAHTDGKVLIAQPDICRNYSYYYDLYSWDESGGLQRKTTCGRYRRAAWLGEQIAALKTIGGVSTLALLEPHGRDWKESRVLYQTPDGVEAIDLATSPDTGHIALVIKKANAWQILEFNHAEDTSQVLFSHDAPLYGLRYSYTGDRLEFIAARDNAYNLWRYTPSSGELTQLSHTYTAVLSHTGVAQDGSVVLGVLAKDGTELRRMQNPAPFAQMKLVSDRMKPLQDDASPPANRLGEPGDYHAIYSIYPRTWLPSMFSDRGLNAYGASTFGSDALGWHSYTADVLWETTQNELIGSFNYDYLGEHLLNFSRNLRARQWAGTNNNVVATIYDRTTEAQWVSMLPWLKKDRRLHLGIGAALRTTERVRIAGVTSQAEDERVAAAFLRHDTRDSNWYADGINRGNLNTLLYESYRPFSSFYDGHVLRFDTRGYFPLGKTVFSARWTEARAHGITEPFQLGGASEYDLTQAPMLNQRSLPLRGYQGSEAVLRGQNARNTSIEWRMPLADIDRHAMTPPIGINRLSAAIFLDAGRAWNDGSGSAKYYRGAGIELISEVKVYYQIPIPLRLGIARGIDEPGKMRMYLRLGQIF